MNPQREKPGSMNSNPVLSRSSFGVASALILGLGIVGCEKDSPKMADPTDIVPNGSVEVPSQILTFNNLMVYPEFFIGQNVNLKIATPDKKSNGISAELTPVVELWRADGSKKDYIYDYQYKNYSIRVLADKKIINDQPWLSGTWSSAKSGYYLDTRTDTPTTENFAPINR